MKTATKLLLSCFVCLAIGAVAGYFIRGNEVEIKTETKYIKGETVERIVEVPAPYEVIAPKEPIYIYKTDTIDNIIVQKVDSAKIIEDWVLKRNYAQTLFDNQDGKLNIDLSVQYNQLQELKYSFTPIRQINTVYKERTWQPFVSGSYSTFSQIGIGGGFFYHDLGFEYQYQRNFNNSSGHLFGVKKRF